MAVRGDPVLDATRRASRQVQVVLDDARAARRSAGLSMTRVAHALGCSRQLIGLLERGGLDDIGTMQLARYCAAPLTTRAVLSALRRGEEPGANGIVLI